MADLPNGIVLRRHRDLAGRTHEIWIRRGLFALLPLVGVLALLNVFGQDTSTVTKSAPEAKLKVETPTRLRGGLLGQARFTITALGDVKDARLELGRGWLEDMTINTLEPSPVGEASANGRLSLDLGHVPAGEKYVLFLSFQVNPTNVGRHDADVTLFDGNRKLFTIDRTFTVFP
jgi:hypothetical protein